MERRHQTNHPSKAAGTDKKIFCDQKSVFLSLNKPLKSLTSSGNISSNHDQSDLPNLVRYGR